MKNRIVKMVVVIVCAIALLVLVGLVALPLTSGGEESVFDKLFSDELLPYVIVCIAVIAVGAALLLIPGAGKIRAKWTTKELIVGALCIALSFVLSYIRLFKMPQGGSITPASMLPVFLFAYIYGAPHGAIVGLATGILQLLQDAYVVHWAQIGLDYVLAYSALCLAGLFKKNILPGIVTGGLTRMFFSFLSGFIFFAEYAPAGQSPVLYSLIYQASYMLPEIAICVVIAALPPVAKTIKELRALTLSRSN